MVVGVIVARALETRPGGLEIAVALGVVAVYLMVFVRMAIPEERTHLIEYGVVAILVHEALLERARNGRRMANPALLAVLVTGLVGAVDESSSWCRGGCSIPSASCSTCRRAPWR